ncbi:MAG: MFS transporter [Eubacteriales bacterium]|nr:MFS transporter [Eubacteriales bacterium]
MEKKSALQSMSKKHRYLMDDIFIAYLAMGLYLTLVGSSLPAIKEEYQISYQIGGLMMSAQQVGYLVMGIFVSAAARRMGAKTAYLLFGSLAFVGLAWMMVSGNPAVLLVSMLLTGICKGSTTNFGNQITSVLSNNDSSLLNFANAFFPIGACLAPLVAAVCGDSWRMGFAITIAVGIGMLLHGRNIQIGPEAFVQGTDTGESGFGFFHKPIFWICCVMLLCYLAFEASLMGWLVTFFVDSGATTETVAQLLATALWVAVLIGRFASAWFATRFRPHQMMIVMALGVVICFTVMMFSHTLVPMAAATFGIGLFMAGMYGTALGGSDNLIGKYPMCMGMFIVIPGIGAAVTQSAIGALADRIGIRGGMYLLYILLATLLIFALLFIRHQKTIEKQKTA